MSGPCAASTKFIVIGTFSSASRCDAVCGVNRAAVAGGQVGNFSPGIAVTMYLRCGPARATAANSSNPPLVVVRFDPRRGAPHLSPPCAPHRDRAAVDQSTARTDGLRVIFVRQYPWGHSGAFGSSPGALGGRKCGLFCKVQPLVIFPARQAPLGGGGSGSK